MHEMCGSGSGCGGCNCNNESMTPEQQRDMLKHKREMLEKKLEWIKEQEAKLADKK